MAPRRRKGGRRPAPTTRPPTPPTGTRPPRHAPNPAASSASGKVAPSPDTVANGTLDAYGYPVGLDVADEVARCVWIYLATSSGEGASVGVYGGSINAPGELLASAKLVRAPIAGWNGLVLIDRSL